MSETSKVFKWNRFSATQKHMVLMYLYRVETDLDHIESYIETYRFRELGINISDLPDLITKKKSNDKKSLAYAIIGKTVPL